MKISKKKLNELKSACKGNIQEIADHAGVSISTVSNVLNGRTHNEAVIRSAVKVRDMKIAERQELENLI